MRATLETAGQLNGKLLIILSKGKLRTQEYTVELEPPKRNSEISGEAQQKGVRKMKNRSKGGITDLERMRTEHPREEQRRPPLQPCVLRPSAQGDGKPSPLLILSSSPNSFVATVGSG